MKKFSSYLLVGMVLASAVSCSNSEYKKTKSGLLYKIMSDNASPVAKKGEWLKVTFVNRVRDSVLYSTYTTGMPIYAQVDSARPTYSPMEIFTMLHKGDSAVVVLSADSIQHKMGQLPPYLKRKDKMVMSFKVLDLFPTVEAKQKDLEAEQGREKEREVSIVEGYLSKNNITTQKTASGAYVAVQSAGDGPAADSGKEVSVRYTGKLIPSEKVFESNASGPGNEPLKFVIGTHQVIPGMDEGIRKFKKGGKGTIYIPAFLAYGERPQPDHKPFQNLAFEVEIIDVTEPKPAPAGAAPGMPGMPGMPGRPGMQMPARPMPVPAAPAHK